MTRSGREGLVFANMMEHVRGFAVPGQGRVREE